MIMDLNQTVDPFSRLISLAGKEKTNISNDLLVFLPAKNNVKRSVRHVAYFVMKLFSCTQDFLHMNERRAN